MTALDFMVFVCVSVLLLEAGFSDDHFFYSSGQTAIMSCGRTPPPTCSKVVWFYTTKQPTVTIIKGNGRSPPSDVRFHLASDCSLVINNVSGEDAGDYICRPDEQTSDMETLMDLNILTVSESPPNTDGNITLQCSLLGRVRCPRDSVRWVNEDGSVPFRQEKCVSTITVKPPSGTNRTYTCQFVYNNLTQTCAEHTLVLLTESKDGQTGNSDPGTILPEHIGAAVGGVVLLVVVIVIVKMRCMKRDKDSAKQTDGFQNQTNPTAEPQSNLTYAMINHKNTGASKEVRKAEAVTYSTVKTQVKTGADNDNVYSTVK